MSLEVVAVLILCFMPINTGKVTNDYASRGGDIMLDARRMNSVEDNGSNNRHKAATQRGIKPILTKSDIDSQNVDADSELEDLLETMSCNGHKAKGIHPELKSTVKAMKLEEKYEEMEHLNQSFSKRNFVPPTVTDPWDRRWDDGIVPFYVDIGTFDDGLRSKVRQILYEATEAYRENTCITLQEISKEETENYDVYIHVLNADGCNSYVGIDPRGQRPGQQLHLEQSGCLQTGTAIHEFGHAIGMRHEQSRTDRDDHVFIHLDNVKDDWRWVFEKGVTLDTNPFDYGSIMQYSLDGFSEKSWLNTISFKDPELEFLADHSKSLSFYDSMDIVKAYNCTEICENFFSGSCLHGGFLDHLCSCRCPEGLEGRYCEKIVSDTCDKWSCGGIIDVSPFGDTVITSPNYPDNYDVRPNCYWLLRAHKDERIIIEVEDFDVASSNITDGCYHWLEVRYNLLGQPGPKYCGSQFDRDKISTTEFGEQNMMMLIFDTSTVSGVEPTKGFKIKARTVIPPENGCTNPPPEVAHSTNNLEEVGSSIGAVVLYTCDEGFYGTGKNWVYCEADGTWTKKRFACLRQDPIFECDFESGSCGIIMEYEDWKWLLEEETNNTLLTVNQDKYHGQFTVPTQLKSGVTYCLSFYYRRLSNAWYCVKLWIGGNDEWPWHYEQCGPMEWTRLIGNFELDTPGTQDTQIQFQTQREDEHAAFTISVDNIVLIEGSC